MALRALMAQDQSDPPEQQSVRKCLLEFSSSHHQAVPSGLVVAD
jgi:hypothetical protein